jgi:uncharacterized membrane protein (UPF0127 family)
LSRAREAQLNRLRLLFYTPVMRVRCGFILLAVSAVVLGTAGCQKSGVNAVAATAHTNAPASTNAVVAEDSSQPYLDHAQPKLRTVRLWIGAKELTSEVAMTVREVSTGMMFRQEIGDNEGMLFVFGRPHRAAFYMRNTVVPLSAAYIDPNGAILEIHELKPLEEAPVTAGSDQVQFVLETKLGWFETNDISPGTIIRTEAGSLMDTFLTRAPAGR